MPECILIPGTRRPSWGGHTNLEGSNGEEAGIEFCWGARPGAGTTRTHYCSVSVVIVSAGSISRKTGAARMSTWLLQVPTVEYRKHYCLCASDPQFRLIPEYGRRHGTT